MRVLGVDVDYTSALAGTTVRVRGLIGTDTKTKDFQAGPSENISTATVRFARTDIAAPKIGDRLLVVSGTAYAVVSVGNVPNSPEWNLGLEHDYQST